MSAEMTAIAMGVHVLDVLVRPVETIPEGQGGSSSSEIRIGPRARQAGPQHAVQARRDRAKCRRDRDRSGRGDARAAAAPLRGRHLPAGPARRGPDLSERAADPPNGERPAFHVIGANGTYGPDDAPWDAIAAARHLHLGGPEFMGGEAAAQILKHAREHGVVTSADILAPGDGLLDWIAPALARSTTCCRMRSRSRLHRQGRRRGRLPRCSIPGRRLCRCDLRRGWRRDRRREGPETVPAFPVDVVDTTGCGDAFSAGFLRGLALGRIAGKRPFSAVRPPRSSRRASAATTASSTSRPPTPSPPRPRLRTRQSPRVIDRHLEGGRATPWRSPAGASRDRKRPRPRPPTARPRGGPSCAPRARALMWARPLGSRWRLRRERSRPELIGRFAKRVPLTIHC